MENTKKNTIIVNWANRDKINAELLINATPIGMSFIKKKYIFSINNYLKFNYYFDAVVKKQNDIFKSKKLKSRFKQYVSGIELSLVQGLEQFKIYTSRKIAFNIMKKKLNYKF